MTDEQFDRLERAIVEHGNQLGTNLAYLKRFLDDQRQAQEYFWADQHAAMEKHQDKMLAAARWSAAAATAAVVATLIAAIGSFA